MIGTDLVEELIEYIIGGRSFDAAEDDVGSSSCRARFYGQLWTKSLIFLGVEITKITCF